jgi:Peptidase family M28
MRRRSRPGSLERPVNGRLYRGTWLLVALPLLIVAFTVRKPPVLAAPSLPPTFDRGAAADLAAGEEDGLATLFPNRSPGSPGALGAARWFAEHLAPFGLEAETDAFEATIPGKGRVTLRNVQAVVPGRSPQTIVVMAHRDNAGEGAGLDDNASGTAALIELARSYTSARAGATGGVRPQHTILFLSTDAGAFGALGARHFAQTSPYAGRTVAVVNLDSLASPEPARVEIGGRAPQSPSPALLGTAAARITEQTGHAPGRTSWLGQLVDLAFPYSLYEQAPFLGEKISALTITTGGDRPRTPSLERPDRLDTLRLGQLGRAAQSLLGSLDEGLELTQGTGGYVYVNQRLVRGWAIELAVFALFLPFAVTAVDLFARCRRRRIPVAPGLRSYRSRLFFWLWAGVLFELFALAGVWPGGTPPAPVNPATSAASHWPRLGLLAYIVLLGLTWLVARGRLIPRRPVTAEEEIAGQTAALLALGVVALLVVATNIYALIFVLPSLHAWLWLPQTRGQRGLVRLALLAAGFAGPLLLLGSFAFRYGLGLDAPWYLAELTAIGYVPIVGVALFLAWIAGAAQLIAVAVGRYAPYPTAAERPPRGPLRNTVRTIVLGVRSRRQAAAERRALEG